MLVTIHSSRPIGGSITAPPSKSMAHRAVLCAALATGSSHITNLEFSKDISATLAAAGQLCARVTTGPADAVVEGLGRFAPLTAPVDCCESGSTLRFLIPIALAAGEGRPVTFRGHGRLMERPLDPYFQIFREKGVAWRQEGDSLTVEGRLPGGSYSLSGKVSSQFVTGLLLALSLLPEPSEIVITDALESRAYVDMTLSAMAAFGVRAENRDYRRFCLPGGQAYRPRTCRVEGDWSQAAFFLGSNFLGSRTEVLGMNPDSLQGDRAVVSILERMSSPGDCTVDAGEIPARRSWTYPSAPTWSRLWRPTPPCGRGSPGSSTPPVCGSRKATGWRRQRTCSGAWGAGRTPARTFWK